MYLAHQYFPKRRHRRPSNMHQPDDELKHPNHEDLLQVELHPVQVGAQTLPANISHSPRNGSNTPVDISQQSILSTTHLIKAMYLPDWASSNLTPGIAFRTLQLERAPRLWFARNQYGTVCRYGLRREVLGVQHLRSTLDPPNVGRLLPRGPGIYCNT